MNIYSQTLGIALLSASCIPLFADVADSTEPNPYVASMYRREPKKSKTVEKPYEYKSRSHYGLITYGDYLFWEAQEDGLEYVAKLSSSNSFVSTSGKSSLAPVQNKVKFKDIHPEYSSGVRIGLGYLTPKEHDSWDIVAQWTGYRNSAHGNAKTVEGDYHNVLSPSFGPAAFSIPSLYTKAKAHWRVSYNVLDLEFGRNYFIGKKLSIRPHLGAEYAFIHQEYKTKYNAPELPPQQTGDVTISPITASFKGRCEFQGGGLRFGADAKLYFTKNFGLQGEVATALLWGNVHVHEKFFISEYTSTSPNSQSITPEVTTKQKAHLKRLRPNLQGAAGLFWQSGLRNDKSYITAALEYEFIAWFFQNNFYPSNSIAVSRAFKGGANFGSTPDRRDGILSLSGLTASLRFDF